LPIRRTVPRPRNRDSVRLLRRGRGIVRFSAPDRCLDADSAESNAAAGLEQLLTWAS
jgi:hypothetical protein